MFFSTEGLGTTCALAAASVDDSITGIPGQKFEQLKKALRERFRLGSWKVQRFGFVWCSSSRESGPYDCS